MVLPSIPDAPNSIQKGTPLKNLLGENALAYLAANISIGYGKFDKKKFISDSLHGLEPLNLLERGKKIAEHLKGNLPDNYAQAVNIILQSLTPPLESTENNGLAVLFYLPHVCFIHEYGLDKNYSNGEDTFEISMKAQYELTKRFSSEFSIRPFLIHDQKRTLERLTQWLKDRDPHVRRLCSEGVRPRLPWAKRIPEFIKNPGPILPILETLKNDESLYVRRSVANNLGDIAKDHPELVFTICEKWLKNATNELKWVIRHALRHPAKKKIQAALELRSAAR